MMADTENSSIFRGKRESSPNSSRISLEQFTTTLSQKEDALQPVEHVFTYGLLMPGQRLHDAVQPYVRRSRFGVIEGALVNLGFCPALIPGDGLVLGMLLDLDPEALRVTDRIEGCRPERDASFYYRKKVSVHLADGERTDAWTYELAHPNTVAGYPHLIVEHIENRDLYAWS